MTSLAASTSIVFALLGLLHVYWALGGRYGSQAAIPQLPVPPGWQADGEPALVNAFEPSRAGMLGVAAVLGGIGFLIGLRGGLLGDPVQHGAVQTVLALVALAMLLRAVGDFRLVGFFKRIKGSRFAELDTWFYSPLCVVLGAGVGWTAFSSPA